MDCICGHNLGQHPPDPQRPFKWPCRECKCTKYREQVPESLIHILDAADTVETMKFVRVHRMHNRTYRVFEGLTNR